MMNFQQKSLPQSTPVSPLSQLTHPQWLDKAAVYLLFTCLFLLFLPVFSLAEEKKESLWIDAADAPPPIEITLPSFAPVIERLGKVVVNISTEGTQEVSSLAKQRGIPAPFADMFPGLPGGGSKRSFKTHSLGSGFVIHQDGYIITSSELSKE